MAAAEAALKEVKFVVKPNSKKENAKKQALKAIDEIVAKLSEFVMKANMRLAIRCNAHEVATLRQKIEDCVEDREGSNKGKWTLRWEGAENASAPVAAPCPDDPTLVEFVFVCDPYYFRSVEKMSGAEVRIVDAQVTGNGTGGVDMLGGDAGTEEPSPPSDAMASLSLGQQGGPGAASGAATAAQGADDVPANALKCTTCGVYFPDVEGQGKNYREHVKTDWHIHNVKRKAKGYPVYTHDQFKEWLVDKAFAEGEGEEVDGI